MKAEAADPRVEVIVDDMPTDEHRRSVRRAATSCLAPSRWDGLGVFLFEAIGVGMPIVTNDHPPMNEVVEDGLNGLLVGSRPDGLASLGIAAVLPDVDDMARAIARLGDQGLRDQLQAGAIEMRERLDWRHTVEGFLASSSGSSPELLQMGESCRSWSLANASLTNA